MSTASTFRRNVTEAGYIAVGLGVMGVDQAKDLGGRLLAHGERTHDSLTTAVTTHTRSAFDRADGLLGDARGRATKVVDDGRSRVRDLRHRAA